ncbi:MAG: hypothetical protein EBW39_12320, partial [Betaproteobacteria bacterium]|nr:hypothetical protein [Betaproteobacteria bacterium]
VGDTGSLCRLSRLFPLCRDQWVRGRSRRSGGRFWMSRHERFPKRHDEAPHRVLRGLSQRNL